MGKFVIIDNGKGPHFNLLASNGQVVGSSEVYNTLAACKNGIESVKKNAAAAVEDTTVEGAEAVKNPKYVVKTDKAGKFRFALQAKNGEVILTSQGYASKASCLNGIESIKNNAPDAEVVEG